MTKLYSGLFGEMPILATPAVGDISSSHTGNEIAIATGRISSRVILTWRLTRGIPSGPTSRRFGNTLWTSADYLCQFWASPVVGDVDGD